MGLSLSPPILASLKSLAFRPRMFRRRRRDDTILSGMKPFFPIRAEVRKRWLINNLPNETPHKRNRGACHEERDSHQRRRLPKDYRRSGDLGLNVAGAHV